MADNDNNEVDVINFYRAGDAYGCFSNFSRHAVWLKDKRWPTSEHYFQAQKFPDTKFEELIRNARDPGDSARLGRDRSKPLRKDWEEVKDEIMRQVVYAKFTQHKDLREILLSTKNALLVEHTVNDSYWGDGGDGSGKNMLGKTLMIVREQIRQELENPSKPLVQSTPKESETIVKENEPITKENSDSNESGESDEEDEIEPNTNNERYVGGLRIISTPSSMDPKKAMAKKRKARRKRNVFVDNSGTSHVERNNEHKGQVNLVGGDKSILFSEKALPPSAKLVLHKHQYQRRFEPDEAELDREEDEEPVGRTRGPKAKNTLSLGDYFPAQKQQQQQEKTNEMPEEYLTVEGCIKAATATLEVLKDLPKTDNQVDELLEQCKLLKGLTLEFIQQEQPEDVTVQLLNTIECLNEVIKE